MRKPRVSTTEVILNVYDLRFDTKIYYFHSSQRILLGFKCSL